MNPEKKKKNPIPIWLAITPNVAVIRVGTTVVSALGTEEEEKEGGIVRKRDGFT